MNLAIRALGDKLIDDLNAAADVPLEAKRLILTDILSLVTKRADEAIINELKASEAENE